MVTALVGRCNSADLVLFSEIVFVGQIWEVPDRFLKRRGHDGISRLASTSNRELAQWCDPKNTGSKFMPRARLFAENTRSILSTQMSSLQRTRSVWVLFAEWAPRY